MSCIGIDINICDPYFGRDDIRKIFEEKAVAGAWLMFEAVVAEVQGELGLIPAEAALEIKEKASLAHVGFENIVKIYGATKHTGKAVVKALKNACSESAGEWVHYGVSSPELWENILAYQLRLVICHIESDLLDIIGYLNRLADSHRNSVMLERSLGRQAQPTTFGFVTAVWSNSMAQHIDRFRESKKRILSGSMKGVVGTYASHYTIGGDSCLKLEKLVLDRLGLYAQDISFSRNIERFTEFMMLLMILAQSFEKIFSDIFFMQREEVGELEEPHDAHGPAGSSSMPQKRNPMRTQFILARCKKIRSNAAVLGDVQVQQSHDMIAFSMENLIIPESCVLIGDVLNDVKYVLRDLVVYPDVMRQNFENTHGLVMAESLMLGLSRKTGKKQEAHDIVRKAVLEALKKEQPFSHFVHAYKPIIEHLAPDEINVLLSPENHLGLVQRSIDAAISKSYKHK